MCPEMGVAVGISAFADLEDVVVVRKTADQIVNNSVVLVDDNELFFAVGANEVWEAVFYIVGTSPTNIPDIKANITGPAGATGFVNVIDANPIFSNIGFLAYSGGLAANHALHRLVAFVRVGATPGNVQLQWAQNVATVEDTTVLENSFIIAHRLA